MAQGRVPRTCHLCPFYLDLELQSVNPCIRLLEVVSHFIKIKRLKLSSRTQMLASTAANNSRTELLKSLFDGYGKEGMVKKDNSECKMSQVFKFHFEN